MTVDKPDEPYGLNDLNVAGIRYLLVGVSSSHLAGLAEGDVRGHPALAESRTGSEGWALSYDLEALLDRIWSPRTLCGREWIEMEPGDGPPFDGSGTGVYAPSCGNCLRIISNRLEGVAPDGRIPLVASLVVTEVLAEAGTVITGVPGDQVESLRTAIRDQCRRLGIPCRTYPMGGDLHVVSERLWDDMPSDQKSEIESRAISAVADAIQGRPVTRRGIAWDTWGVV